jgi:protocatechuate 3,4-dioxygenase beta subunit
MLTLVVAVVASIVASIVASPAPAPVASPSPSPRPAPAHPATPASPAPPVAPSKPRGPVLLEGTVRGPEGPVADALVMARAEQTEYTRPPVTSRTSATGQFRLTLDQPPPYTVRVEAPGLAPRAFRHVRRGPPLAITLARGAFIDGVVRESTTGAPVPEATVEAREESRSAIASRSNPDLGVVRTKTDTKGRFRLEGLATGLHTVTAFARAVGRAEKRSVPSGRPIEITLVPGGGVSGTVTDSKGKPVEGAAVRALPALPGNWVSLVTRSDAGGSFAFHGAPPGTYRVVATAPEFAAGIVETVIVERDGETRADVVLPAASSVRGRLMAAAGKPTRGSVALREIAGEPAPDAIADEFVAEASDDGLFNLRVGPGSHVVEAGAPGFAKRRLEVEVPAGGGDGVDLGDVMLEVGIAIRGRVRDSASQPIEGALVTTYSDDGDEFDTRSQADGTYTLAGLSSAGLFTVYASAPGMGRAQRKAEAGATGIDFVLERGGSIAGTVVDEAGRPVDAFRVYARPPVIIGGMGAGRGETFGAADGRFLLEDLGAGEYVVDVTAPDRAPTVVSGVKVPVGGTGNAGTIRLTPGGIVRGVVVDTSSAPVTGASVYISGPGRDYTRSVPEVLTDAGGSFELRGVPPGMAQVRVVHSAYTQGLVSGVDVDPSRGPAEIRVVMTQGGRIEGRVRSRDGALPAGLVVTARSQRAGVPWFTPTGPNLQPVAADGSFVLEHVPSGTVAVELLSGRGGSYQGSQAAPAEVREGETTTVEIVLRSIAISGKVTRGGAPLAGARIEFYMPTTWISSGGGNANTLPPNAAITREDGSYDLVVSAAGKASVNIETADRRANLPAPPVEVPDADTYSADFNFGGAFIEGVVVEKETDQPILGASVGATLVAAPAGQRRYAGAESGRDGRFRIDGVDPGEYTLTLRADTYGTESSTLTVGENGVSGLRVTLARGLTIRGRVVDAGGRPVGGVIVAGMAGEETMPLYGYGRTLPDGSFEMANLAEKPYTLSVQGDGGVFAIVPAVPPGSSAVTLTLRPGGRVQVTVNGPDGAPVPRVSIGIARVQGSLVRRNLSVGTTGASGTVEMVLPAGTVELMTLDPEREARTTVTVPSGGTAAAELVLPARRP